MNYSGLVDSYIKKSGLSLAVIAKRMEVEKGIKIDRSYISKLKNDPKYPATEEINRALAEITGGDPEALIMAAYLEKAPDSVKELFDGVKDTNVLLDEIFSILTKLFVPDPDAMAAEVKEQLIKEQPDDIEIFEKNFSEYKDSPEKMFSGWPVSLKIEFLETIIRESGKQTKIPFTEMMESLGYDIDEIKRKLIYAELKSYEPFSTLYLPIVSSISVGEEDYEFEFDEGHTLSDPELLRGREAMALRVKGDSMSGDRILDGDIVICVKQFEVQPHEIAVVAVNEDKATLRRVKLQGDMVMLSASNPAYEPQLLPANDVSIIGKVVEVKFYPK